MLNNCCKLIASIEIALNGTTSLQITIPAETFNNGETFGLYLAQAIPSTGTPLPVEILIGTTAYNLLKPCGNYVMSDQLRTKRFYPLRVGTNPAHFTVRHPATMCRTAYVAPQLIPAATTTGA